MRFAVTRSADMVQSLPASLSAFLCGCLGYGRSAATLLTRLLRIHPSSHQEGGVDAIGRLYPLKPPCVSLRSAAVTLHCAIR